VIYFTSDFHFSHKLVALETRSFKALEEHDQCILDGLNSTLKSGDILYFLGDWMLGSSRATVQKAIEYRHKIKCKQIFMVWGNHDKYLRRKPEFEKWFVKCSDLMDIKIEEQSIVLCHYAMRTWNKAHYKSWMLYGHSHGSLPDNPNALSVDVGVDCWGFKPVSYEQLIEVMAKKEPKPVDHHIGDLDEMVTEPV
jgi:calcineurin-like phosphoesterase family protein